MKKSFMILLVGILLVGVVGVGIAFDVNRDINVISREAGSGTRGAFIELMGIQAKTDAGTVDRTTVEAIIANGTDVVLASVASNPYAIGYISLGSLNDRVEALNVDGVAPTQENIAAGSYKVARPFNIAYKELSTVAQDFVNFIMSAEGQAIVAGSYIPVVDGKSFTTSKPAGRIVVAGSTSVAPLMEKLQEAYATFNPNARIEIQASGSSAGMISAIEGTSDIGMASRELSDAEKGQLNHLVIAQDGIAVIVHNDNPVENVTAEQLKNIYIGELTKWSL